MIAPSSGQGDRSGILTPLENAFFDSVQQQLNTHQNVLRHLIKYCHELLNLSLMGGTSIEWKAEQVQLEETIDFLEFEKGKLNAEHYHIQTELEEKMEALDTVLRNVTLRTFQLRTLETRVAEKKNEIDKLYEEFEVLNREHGPFAFSSDQLVTCSKQLNELAKTATEFQQQLKGFEEKSHLLKEQCDLLTSQELNLKQQIKSHDRLIAFNVSKKRRIEIAKTNEKKFAVEQDLVKKIEERSAILRKKILKLHPS